MSVCHPLYDQALPQGWKVLTVDEIKSPDKHSCVAGPFGSSISSKFFVDDGVPVIRGSNLTDDLTRFVAKNFVFVSEEQAKKYAGQIVVGDDLVFTCWGTIGQVGIIPKAGPFSRYVISNKQLKLKVDPTVIDPLYTYFYFACPEAVEYVRSHAKGAAVPGISLGILKGLKIAFPPLPTQRRIASVLSAYDDLIENNTRRITILEEMARRLYEEWFVQFRFPGHEEINFVETKHGPEPEGWKWKQLRGHIELSYGKALKATERVEGPFPVYGSSGVVGTHEDYLVEGPGLIVGRKGNVGSVHWSTTPFYPIDTTYYVKTDLPLEYVYHNLLLQNFLNNDAAVPGLNREQAYSLPFLLPSSQVLEMFTEQCRPLLALARQLERVNANLRAQRDLLLPKLISGEIDVDVVEPEKEGNKA